MYAFDFVEIKLKFLATLSKARRHSAPWTNSVIKFWCSLSSSFPLPFILFKLYVNMVFHTLSHTIFLTSQK